VTALGTLFVWGHHSDHQLGIALPSDLGSDQPLEIPTICKMPDDRAVRQVACGWTHTIALTQDGCVFTWGSGRFGILGHGGEDKPEERPKQVQLKQGNGSGEEAIFVACGQWTTGVVVRGRRDQKQMYLWGAGSDGQLGNGKHEPEISPFLLALKGERPNEAYKEPGLVDKIFKALDENGDGDISADELEHWLDENHFLEMGESSQFTKEVVMGFVRKIDVNGDGHISREELEGFFSQFENDKGDYMPEVRSLCFGMKHTVCCTKDGHVYTWGSNEFGQLGYEFDEHDQKVENQLVPKLIRPLSEVLSFMLNAVSVDNNALVL
jgi:alpha-tubulin suppressor-like RCC1 family protein